MGLAGVAQVDVHIHKPRQHQLPGSVDDLRARRLCKPFADFPDNAVLHQQVVDAVQPVFGADDPSIFDQNHCSILLIVQMRLGFFLHSR